MKLDGLSLLHAWLRPAEVLGLVQGKKQSLGGLTSGKKHHKLTKLMPGDVRGNLTGVGKDLTGPVRHLTGRRRMLNIMMGNMTNVSHGGGSNQPSSLSSSSSITTATAATATGSAATATAAAAIGASGVLSAIGSVVGVGAGGGGGSSSTMVPVAKLTDHYNSRVFLWHKDTEQTPVDARLSLYRYISHD